MDEDFAKAFEDIIQRQLKPFADNIAQSFDAVGKEFDSLKGEMDARFDSLKSEMDARFDSLKGEMDARFDSLETDVKEIKAVQQQHTQVLNRHTDMLVNHTAMLNNKADKSDVIDLKMRVSVLERKVG